MAWKVRAFRTFFHGMRLAVMGYVAPHSHEDKGKESTRPRRLRAVLLVSIMASVVALALGAAGAIGLWYHAQPLDDPTVDGQPSLQALAGRALTGAREVGAFVRRSATRDLSRAISLLKHAEPRAAPADGEDMQAPNGARPADTAGRTMERSSKGSRPERLSHAEGPVLTTDVALPRAVPLSIAPTLHLVFDRRDPNVTPPLMHRVRLRSAIRPGPSSQAASEETGLVEVIVSVSGTVESAKFVTKPVDVHEAMLLSAVKAWRFRPAMRHGYAIRYRLRVPISRVRI